MHSLLWLLCLVLSLALRNDSRSTSLSPQQEQAQFYQLMKLKMNVLQQQLQAKQQLISIYEQQKADQAQLEQNYLRQQQQKAIQDKQNENGDDLFIMPNDMMDGLQSDYQQQNDSPQHTLTNDQQDYLLQQQEQQQQESYQPQVFMPDQFQEPPAPPRRNTLQPRLIETDIPDIPTTTNTSTTTTSTTTTTTSTTTTSPNTTSSLPMPTNSTMNATLPNNTLSLVKSEILSEIGELETSHSQELNKMQQNISEITELLQENHREEEQVEKQLMGLNGTIQQGHLDQSAIQLIMDHQLALIQNTITQLNHNSTQLLEQKLTHTLQQKQQHIDIDNIKKELYNQIYTQILTTLNNTSTPPSLSPPTSLPSVSPPTSLPSVSPLKEKLKAQIQDPPAQKDIASPQFIEKDDDPLDLKSVFKHSQNEVSGPGMVHSAQHMAPVPFIYSANQIYSTVYLNCSQTLEDLPPLSDFTVYSCLRPDDCFSPENEVSEVIGDGPYREDSNICRAALHGSVIQEDSPVPQFFRILTMESQLNYASSSRNGIDSILGGPQGRAFQLKPVLQDNIVSCQEFKETYEPASFETQWKVLYGRKGGFWQHYSEGVNKGIKYIDLGEASGRVRPLEYDSLIVRQHHLCDSGLLSFSMDLKRTSRSADSAVGVVFNLQHSQGQQQYLGLEVQLATPQMLVYKKYQGTYHQIAAIQRDEVSLDQPMYVEVKTKAGEVALTINRQPLVAFQEYLLTSGSFGFYVRSAGSLLIRNLHFRQPSGDRHSA